MTTKIASALFVLMLGVGLLCPPAHAQFGSGIVFDPTQSTHAIEQIREAHDLFTTAAQTRDQIIQSYNLARQMANLPQALYGQLAAPWTNWSNVSAPNTYGNTAPWTSAVNTGIGSVVAYEKAVLSAPRYLNFNNLDARSQQIVSSVGATADLIDGIAMSNLATLGQIRANSEARWRDLEQLQSATFSSDPAQHTEMATLQRINAATLMQLRAQQEANQIAAAAALQQMMLQKMQTDALKQSLQDAATYGQNYRNTMQPLTTGFTETLNQSNH
jgi:hypothetical protein